MKMWIETERTPYVNKTYLEQFKDSILSTDLSNSYRDSISLAPYTNSIFCLNMKNIILANQILANQKKKKKIFLQRYAPLQLLRKADRRTKTPWFKSPNQMLFSRRGI